MTTLKTTLVMLGSGALLFGACGDDGDGKGNPDAGEVEFDATPRPDAEPPVSNFSGTLSLAEVTVTNPEAGGASGGVANISFTDPDDVTVPPQPGYTNNIGACRIFVYDLEAGESPPGGSDGGPVSVTGTENGPFTCAYTAAVDSYVCTSNDAAAAGAVAVDSTQSPVVGGNGVATLTIEGADFSGANYVGMWINVDGFPADDGANGRFPIVGQPETDSLLIFNPGLAVLGSTAVTAGTYQTFVGQGPVPGGAEFLDDGTSDITFTKDAVDKAPAIDSTLTANGEGFALADGSALPHAVPVDGSAVTFSCDGSCGTTGGLLQGLILFGSTTDGDVEGTSFSDMPAPVSSFATFQCSAIGMKSATLDAGAMALLLGTNPTRIQTSVTYANALSGTNNIVVSHGVVGFTTIEP